MTKTLNKRIGIYLAAVSIGLISLVNAAELRDNGKCAVCFTEESRERIEWVVLGAGEWYAYCNLHSKISDKKRIQGRSMPYSDYKEYIKTITKCTCCDKTKKIETMWVKRGKNNGRHYVTKMCSDCVKTNVNDNDRKGFKNMQTNRPFPYQPKLSPIRATGRSAMPIRNNKNKNTTRFRPMRAISTKTSAPAPRPKPANHNELGANPLGAAAFTGNVKIKRKPAVTVTPKTPPAPTDVPQRARDAGDRRKSIREAATQARKAAVHVPVYKRGDRIKFITEDRFQTCTYIDRFGRTIPSRITCKGLRGTLMNYNGNTRWEIKLDNGYVRRREKGDRVPVDAYNVRQKNVYGKGYDAIKSHYKVLSAKAKYFTKVGRRRRRLVDRLLHGNLV